MGTLKTMGIVAATMLALGTDDWSDYGKKVNGAGRFGKLPSGVARLRRISKARRNLRARSKK